GVLVPVLSIVAVLASLGLTIWQWDANTTTIAGALRVDDLALALNGVFAVSAAATVLLSWRATAPREAGGGEDYALLLFGAAATALRGDVLTDPLFLTGLALIITGLGFKAYVAPFHQWTPDVYDGAPTPITAFMATATKAAAFGVLLRLFDVAFIDAQIN